MSFILCQTRYSSIIHQRLISASEIIRQVVYLTSSFTVLSYLLLKVIDYRLPVGMTLLKTGVLLFFTLLLTRYIERWIIKRFRSSGRNTRTVTLIGKDPELDRISDKLTNDPSLGYRTCSVYDDVDTFLDTLSSRPDELEIGDELYLCVSRRRRDAVQRIARLCDRHVTRFYFVPVSVESLGINLKSELVDDMELFTPYDNPLANPLNQLLKRALDIVMSGVALLLTAIISPFVVLMIKLQSPHGPIFFRQDRTGLDGRSFRCYKFRSMHVNKDADKLQATEDDPRKFSFGNFMRKCNIDELPQFWNVLKGDMSIVGPRPHMLAHTEQYSALIDKYMVRHFVKPGVTGWSQVTGFRGETKELWQMEGRVMRDIWYIEHWSVWLDLRIMWMTLKSIFIHDDHAY
ncbi:MAG: exopolysaccharide biosynthesis polyprenyl glycosylphosphotransferase [Prevotella sp.]|nr:exopolysaccharide biosynthesis polyprenyl glycosylphosphotransferase [Prevotella sp.]